jgi:RNA polymerase-binding transcription factor DksA
MADEIDIANDLAAIQLARALEEMRKNSSQGTSGSKYCVECGDDIPLARKKLGFKLCVPCVEETERKKQLFAG